MKAAFSSILALLLASASVADAAVSMHHSARRGHGQIAKRVAHEDKSTQGLDGPPWLEKRTNKHKRSCKPKSNSTTTNGNTNSGASSPPSNNALSTGGGSGGLRFPELGFQMPDDVPTDLTNWWADPSTEYAFVGFSYEISACQSQSQLTSEFKNIRNKYKGRYIRLYGACDNKNYYDQVANAAWEAGLGVHALLWFGFDGGNEWKGRWSSLINTLKNNAKARAVTRIVQFGSEPLFDGVLGGGDGFLSALKSGKNDLESIGIPHNVSDMAYGFQQGGNAIGGIFGAMDEVDVHMLPFFGQQAGAGADAWPAVSSDLKWVQSKANGKKIWFSENGWPSVQSDGVKANSADAVANVDNEQDYFKMLDSKCSFLKSQNIGYFFHIYSDNQEPGYGLLDTSGKPKFQYAPQTSC